jgi:hypothetical protein
MIEKPPRCPERVRKSTGSVAFIAHRFVRQGFWATLRHHALLLYVLLVLVADRNGLSYDSFDKLCALLPRCPDDDLVARNALIHQDLIAFDGLLFQVLSLPDTPVVVAAPALRTPEQMRQADPATIQQIIRPSLGEDED